MADEFIDRASEDIILTAAQQNQQARALLLARLRAADMGTREGRELFDLAASGTPSHIGKLSDAADKRLLEIQRQLVTPPSLDEAEAAAGRLVQMAGRRQARQRVLAAGSELRPDSDLSAFVGRLAADLVQITQRLDRGSTYTMADAVEKAEGLVANWESDDPYAGTVPTMQPRLDRIMGGMERGHLFVVAADSGIGKTSWMLRVLRDTALRLKGQGINRCVVAVELEMMPWVLAYRLASMATGINWQDVRFKRVGEQERTRWRDALHAQKDLPLLIEKIARPSSVRLRNKIEGAALEHGYDGVELIGVDYIELMHGDGTNETAEVGDIVTGLKSFVAEYFECPILSISQLNREVQRRADRMPHTSDLKQSKTIEDIANDIALGYWPERYQSDIMRERDAWPTTSLEENARALGKTGHNFVWTLAKLRDGNTGSTVKMWYDRFTTSFYDDRNEYLAARGNIIPDLARAKAKLADDDGLPDWMQGDR